MKTIAVLKMLPNVYGYLVASPDTLVDGVMQWRTVSDEKYQEIINFINQPGSKYALFEKTEESFDLDFEQWKKKNDENVEKMKKKEAECKAEEEKLKKLEKERKLKSYANYLKKHGVTKL